MSVVLYYINLKIQDKAFRIRLMEHIYNVQCIRLHIHMHIILYEWIETNECEEDIIKKKKL